MNTWLKRLLAADFFIILAMGMLTPIYAVFVSEIGGDVLDASGAWAAFAFSAGVLMYFMGKWEDKGRKYVPMLILGYALRGLAFLGYIWVENTWQLFIVQAIIGVTLAITTPSYDALYSAYLDKGKYASDWGLWEAMNMIVSAVAAIVGGLIVTFFSFDLLFALMAVGSFTAAVIISGMKITKKAQLGV